MKKLFSLFPLWFLLLAHLCDDAMATAITSLKLVTTNGTDIGLLRNGDVLVLDDMPVAHWTIVAVSSGIVKSVRFTLADTNFNRVENRMPYSLNGDYPSGHYAWRNRDGSPLLGMHQLTVTPYTLSFGTGTVGIVMQMNFTVVQAAPTTTPSPTSAPIQLSSSNPVYPLGRCRGECFHDLDCEVQLHCFHRSGLEAVPGCLGLGIAGRGYCARIIVSSTPGAVDYEPGETNVHQNGLMLSQGLLSRIIAVSGSPVKFYSPAGRLSLSAIPFHMYPDGAVVFSRPETDGWVYVTNSEDELAGGVGAIYFDSHGHVKGYQKILSGTSRNCGGGKMFWNTWLTAEEHDDGQIWQVDPWGSSFAPHATVLSSKRKMNYESVAYDNRKMSRPRFYATVE
jgi:Bacterial protein of unknown function (DUF839)